MMELPELDTDELSRYDVSPIPSDLDRVVQAYVQRATDMGRLEQISASHSEKQRNLLMGFIERSASLAVRVNDTAPLEPALIGACLLHRSDRRAAQSLTSLVWHSAEKLGVDPKEVLARIPQDLAERTPWVARWHEGRPPERRTIGVMNFVEGEDEQGFRYVYVIPQDVPFRTEEEARAWVDEQLKRQRE